MFRRKRTPDEQLTVDLRRVEWAVRAALDTAQGDRELVSQAVLTGMNEWEIVNG